MVTAVVATLLLVGMTTALPVSIVVLLPHLDGACHVEASASGPRRVEIRGCPLDPCSQTVERTRITDAGTVERYQAPAFPEITRCRALWDAATPPDPAAPEAEEPLPTQDGSTEPAPQPPKAPKPPKV